MRYIMKQHIFSVLNNYTIRDETEREVFCVKGRLSLGNKLSFEDMSGNEMAFIDQQLLNWGPTYEITHQGQHVATVRKELFTLFKCRFQVDVPGPDDLEAEGNFLDHEYAISRGGFPVAHISKQWFSYTDTYGIDIAEDQNDVLILASAVVIDLCCHEGD